MKANLHLSAATLESGPWRLSHSIVHRTKAGGADC
jgi:hypothetical protein